MRESRTVPAVAARLLAGSSSKLVHSEHNVWSRYRWPTYVANAVTYRRDARLPQSFFLVEGKRPAFTKRTVGHDPGAAVIH